MFTVFPNPVWQQVMTSLPARIVGIIYFCAEVGLVYFVFLDIYRQRFSKVSLLEALNWCYGLFSCNLNWNLIVLVTDDASLDGTEHLLLILRWIWGKICPWAWSVCKKNDRINLELYLHQKHCDSHFRSHLQGQNHVEEVLAQLLSLSSGSFIDKIVITIPGAEASAFACPKSTAKWGQHNKKTNHITF